MSVVPVVKLDSSLARNRIAFAISMGFATLFSIARAETSATESSNCFAVFPFIVMSVSV